MGAPAHVGICPGVSPAALDVPGSFLLADLSQGSKQMDSCPRVKEHSGCLS